MAISIDYPNRVIFVPQADCTFVSGTFYRLPSKSVFKAAVDALMDNEEGIIFPHPIDHNTEYTVAGVQYAPKIEVVNGYSVQFTPNSAWSVEITESNNNLWDVGGGVLVQNQVQVIPTNSAGLIISGSGVTGQDKLDIASLVWEELESAHQAVGTMGRWLSFIRKLVGNKAAISPDDSTSTIYEDDKSTPYHVFDHSDERNRDPQ